MSWDSLGLRVLGLAIASMTLACGDDDDSQPNGDAGETTSGDAGPTATSDETGPTDEGRTATSAGSTTRDPTGDLTDTSTSGSSTTGSTAADTSATDGSEASTLGTDESTDTADGGATGETGDTGTIFDSPCEQDEDCVVLNDCWSCAALAVDDSPPYCALTNCFAPACIGDKGTDLLQAVCRSGRCELQASCDVFGVEEDPVTCDPGTLPEVREDAFTGRCVDSQICDYVPDCSHCSAGESCVSEVLLTSIRYRCERIPESCGDEPPTCDCFDPCDIGPAGACGQADDGMYFCSCPGC